MTFSFICFFSPSFFYILSKVTLIWNQEHAPAYSGARANVHTCKASMQARTHTLTHTNTIPVLSLVLFCFVFLTHTHISKPFALYTNIYVRYLPWLIRLFTFQNKLNRFVNSYFTCVCSLIQWTNTIAMQTIPVGAACRRHTCRSNQQLDIHSFLKDVF